MNKNLVRLSATFIWALCLATAPFSAMAIEEGGIGSKPANPRTDNPRSSSIFVYELKPGESIRDEVQVINNTTTPKTLAVYAVDSQVASGGTFSCAQKVDQLVSVGSWIKVEKGEVTLEPGSYENVAFTINVPASASAGESNGCIVVQDMQRSSVAEGGGITLSFRTAIRVAVTVPGEITKNLAFTGVAAQVVENKKMRLTAGLKNNGNVSLDADVRLDIKTILGSSVATAGGTFPVLARSEASFNFEIDQPFWGGWYVIDSQAGYNDNASESIGEGTALQTTNGQPVTVFIAPSPVAAAIEIVVLVTVLGALALLVISKLRHKKLHAKAVNYSVKHGETLHSVASKFNVKWQLIAKLNKLKPPYHLESGKHLKIPRK